MAMISATYVEEGYQPPSEAFINDEIYRIVLSRWVKACVDIVPYFFYGKTSCKMVIAKRKIQPMMDWWVFGGRVLPTDQSFQGALSRKLKEEIGLPIDPARISRLPMRLHMYKWSSDNSVIMAPVFYLRITQEEYAIMQKNVKSSPEYSGLEAVKPLSVKGDKKYHPALRDIASTLYFRV